MRMVSILLMMMKMILSMSVNQDVCHVEPPAYKNWNWIQLVHTSANSCRVFTFHFITLRCKNWRKNPTWPYIGRQLHSLHISLNCKTWHDMTWHYIMLQRLKSNPDWPMNNSCSVFTLHNSWIIDRVLAKEMVYSWEFEWKIAIQSETPNPLVFYGEVKFQCCDDGSGWILAENYMWDYFAGRWMKLAWKRAKKISLVIWFV